MNKSALSSTRCTNWNPFHFFKSSVTFELSDLWIVVAETTLHSAEERLQIFFLLLDYLGSKDIHANALEISSSFSWGASSSWGVSWKSASCEVLPWEVLPWKVSSWEVLFSCLQWIIFLLLLQNDFTMLD